MLNSVSGRQVAAQGGVQAPADVPWDILGIFAGSGSREGKKSGGGSGPHGLEAEVGRGLAGEDGFQKLQFVVAEVGISNHVRRGHREEAPANVKVKLDVNGKNPGGHEEGIQPPAMGKYFIRMCKKSMPVMRLEIQARGAFRQ